MRKTILLVSVVTAITFACSDNKKDYKCTCTGYAGGTVVTSQSTMINETKENAVKACEGGSSGTQSDTSAYVVCKIE